MKFFLIALCLHPLFALSQKNETGTISGNALWKYNDYVGNKPDAGSRVIVYPFDSTQEQLTTQCDVQGNFRFENVPAGLYLVAVVSRNTRTNGEYNYRNLQFTDTKSYLGFDFKSLNKELYDSISIYREVTLLPLPEVKTVPNGFNTKKYLKEVEERKSVSTKRQGDYEKAINRLLRLAPINTKTMWFEFPVPYPNKFFLDEVIIKPGQTVTVIADFGITYL